MRNMLSAMPRALLLIDIQRDYFPGGEMPLPGSEAAAEAAARLLSGFRARGEPVIHVQHIWDEPDAQYMRPGTPGAEHDPRVAPAPGERLVTKESPNAFIGTDLEAQLRELDAQELVVAGMMTSMCVDATVRAAVDLGFAVTVAGDACAAPDLRHGETTVTAEQVHAAFLAALADGYADVVEAAALA